MGARVLRSVLQSIGAGLVALLVLSAVFWLWLLTGDRSEQIPGVTLSIPAAAMNLAEGQGEVSGQSVVLREASERGRAALVASIPDRVSDVSRYETLVVHLEPSTPQPRVVLMWGAPDSGRIDHFHELAGQQHFELKLEPLHGWPDEIALLGIGLQGPGIAGTRVESLVLRRPTPSAGTVYRDVWRDWMTHVPFSQSTINVVPAGAPGALVAPTVAAAAWLLLAVVLYSAYQVVKTRSISPAGVLLLVAVAWLLLDMRWQANLIREHLATAERFAAVPVAERGLAEFGGSDLLALTADARASLAPDARILIATEDEGLGWYARYRLLPLVAYFREPWSHKLLAHARRGDGALILGRNDVAPLGLRRGLTAEQAEGFPHVLSAEAMEGAGFARVEGSDAEDTPLVREYRGDGRGRIRGSIAAGIPSGFYRAVVRLRMREESAAVRFRVVRDQSERPSASDARIVERILQPKPGPEYKEYSVTFGLPARDVIGMELAGVSPGARVEEFRLEYSGMGDDWFILSRDQKPPYVVGRLRSRTPVGMLFELQ